MTLSRPYKLAASIGLALTCLSPVLPTILAMLTHHEPWQTEVGARRMLSEAPFEMLLAGFVAALAAALWHGWHLLLAAFPTVRAIAGRVPVAARLVASLGLALVAALYPLVLGVELVTSRPYTDRESVLRAMAVQAAPAWPDLQALFERGLPPEGRVPQSRADVQALMAHPYVESAFLLSPMGKLVLYTKPGSRYPAMTIETDLATWHPRTLGPFYHPTRRVVQGPPDHHLRIRELFIQQIADHAADIVSSERMAFRPLEMRSDADALVVAKGNRRFGYAGYTVDESALRRDAAGVLARHGLDEVVELGLGPASMVGTHAIAPPADATPLMAHTSLWPIGRSVGEYVDRETGRQLVAAVLLSVVALFAAAMSLKQLRAFWDQRAIAVAQSDFVSAVSHEMRTPLTTIKLYAEMIDQEVVTAPEKRSAYLKTIAKECDRLSRLVENVLDYARISGRRKAYHFEPQAIAPLVEEALSALEAPLAADGLIVECDVPEGLSAPVDRDAVVQALINLLGNAAKYAAEGGRILVTARLTDAGVALAVQDFGPGIAPTEQRKIFEPFYRPGSELTRTTTGTGLGLALVKAYAEAHDGRIELESAPGQGSTFTLWLPTERKAA